MVPSRGGFDRSPFRICCQRGLSTGASPLFFPPSLPPSLALALLPLSIPRHHLHNVLRHTGNSQPLCQLVRAWIGLWDLGVSNRFWGAVVVVVVVAAAAAVVAGDGGGGGGASCVELPGSGKNQESKQTGPLIKREPCSKTTPSQHFRSRGCGRLGRIRYCWVLCRPDFKTPGAYNEEATFKAETSIIRV